MLDHGLKVAVASDTTQDVFVPLGNANMRQVLTLTAYAYYIGSRKDVEKLFDMITVAPTSICRKKAEHQPGHEANMVILEAADVYMVIVEKIKVWGVYIEVG